MEWKLFTSTFFAIFIAEMGDKTQLATLAMAGSSSSRWVIFAGASLALVATTAVAVIGGSVLYRCVPPIWINRAAGVTFLVLGVLFLLSKPEVSPPAQPDPPAATATQPDPSD